MVERGGGTSETDTSENARLRAVDRAVRFSSSKSEALVALTASSAAAYRAAAAAISFIGQTEERLGATCGFTTFDIREPQVVPRDQGLGGLVLEAGEFISVADTDADGRLFSHPWVTSGMRAFAAVPIKTDEGYVIGALMVIDDKARPDFGRLDPFVLRGVADAVVSLCTQRPSMRNEPNDPDGARTTGAGSTDNDGQAGFAHERADAVSEILLQSLEEMVIACDSDGRITLMNAVARSQFGAGDSLKHIDDLADACRAEQVAPDGGVAPVEPQARLQRALRGEHISGELVWFFPANAPKFLATSSAKPLRTASGEQLGVVEVLKDVTIETAAFEALTEMNAELEERVLERTAAAREARRRAEEANKAKSTFLASMSHELRTPMNAILNMPRLVLEDMESGKFDEEFTLTALRSTIKNGSRLLDLIDEILDYQKIESGLMTIEYFPVQIREFIDEIIVLAQDFSPQNQNKLGMTLSADVPEIFSTDPKRLRQCLFNLLGNAQKFTKSGHIETIVTFEHQNLMISVVDNGIGIPENRLKPIFEDFTQADSSTTRKYGGSGLGLAITSRLVGLMRGQIAVQSKKGQGSTFTIKLPSGGNADFEPAT